MSYAFFAAGQLSLDVWRDKGVDFNVLVYCALYSVSTLTRCVSKDSTRSYLNHYTITTPEITRLQSIYNGISVNQKLTEININCTINT